MAFDFPTSPANGAEYTSGGVTYVWNGQGWTIKGGAGGGGGLDEAAADLRYVNVPGDTMTGALTINSWLQVAGTAADPFNVTTPTGISCRGNYTVAGTTNWTSGILTDGNWSLANESAAKQVYTCTPAGVHTFNDTVTVSGNLTAADVSFNNLSLRGGNATFISGAGQGPSLVMNDGVTNRSSFEFIVSTGKTRMVDIYSVSWLEINPAGAFEYGGGGGNAIKVGGGPWNATSDLRIKNVVGDYTSGLAAVLALRPVTYTYKGNDTDTADISTTPHNPDAPPVTSAPYPKSAKFSAAQSGKTFIGLVAQEAETVMPEMVSQGPGFIDGAEVADMRTLDSNALTYALINAVKEMTARIEALEVVVAAMPAPTSNRK